MDTVTKYYMKSDRVMRCIIVGFISNATSYGYFVTLFKISALVHMCTRRYAGDIHSPGDIDHNVIQRNVIQNSKSCALVNWGNGLLSLPTYDKLVKRQFDSPHFITTKD